MLFVNRTRNLRYDRRLLAGCVGFGNILLRHLVLVHLGRFIVLGDHIARLALASGHTARLYFDRLRVDCVVDKHGSAFVNLSVCVFTLGRQNRLRANSQRQIFHDGLAVSRKQLSLVLFTDNNVAVFGFPRV